MVDYSPPVRVTFNQVVEERSGVDPLSQVFHALADPTRRAMLRQLTDREQTVGELAQPFAMSFAAASKHVKVLERAGLVRRSIRGRNHHCQLDASGLAQAQRWLAFYERYWTTRLDALDTLLLRSRAPLPEDNAR
jgi:DNA-binding transcriptional ArsR family regulator